mgnify:CR=1
MMNSQFLVQFLDDKIEIYAFTFEEAHILAQAERIKTGKNYQIVNSYILCDQKWLSLHSLQSD